MSPSSVGLNFCDIFHIYYISTVCVTQKYYIIIIKNKAFKFIYQLYELYYIVLVILVILYILIILDFRYYVINIILILCYTRIIMK